MKKRSGLILFSIITIMLLIYIFYSPYLDIIRMALSQEDVIMIDKYPEKYLVRQENGINLFNSFLKDKEYVFSKKVGNILTYTNYSEEIICSVEKFGRSYYIIEVTRESKVPSDFGFIFKYGVGAKNILDTFNSTFTKDMIIEDSVSIGFKLDEKENKKIYNKMIEIGLFDYPQKFSPYSNTFVTPYESYYFKMVYDGKVKEIVWEDENLSKDRKSNELRSLINLIKETIHNSKEYKSLPEAKGGYD